MKQVLFGFTASAFTLAAVFAWLFAHRGQSYFVYVVPAAVLVPTLLSPSLRWLAGSSAFFVPLLLAVSSYELYVRSLPTFDGSPGDVLGVAMLVFSCIAFCGGAILRLLASAVVAAVTKAQPTLQSDAPAVASRRQTRGFS